MLLSAANDVAIACFLLSAACFGYYYWRRRRQALNTATLPTTARTSVVNPINVSVLA
jgi:hypothetical protein